MGDIKIKIINIIYLCIISFIISGESLATELSEIEYLTESYPPYSYLKDDKLEGLSVDLLLASMASINEPFDAKKIKLLPWARAYRMVSTGKNRVLFSMTRTTAREELFSWVGPITPNHIVLFARKQDAIILNNIKSLKKYKIGVVRDDVGEQLLLSSGVDKTYLKRVNSATVLINMLDLGHINLFAYDEDVIRRLIKEAGLSVDKFEVVYTLTQGQLYFAFSLGTEQSLIDKLQTGVDRVKQIKLGNGKTQYEVIMDKYFSR